MAAATTAREAIGILLSYGLGCLSGGYYVVRLLKGQDIRQSGSGSTGAKNVGRLLGPAGFTATFVFDLLKGGLAVWAGQRLGFGAITLTLVLLAVVAGHIWPAQLGFRGGKGVSTAFGGVLFYNPWFALVMIVVFAVALALTRRSVVAGMLAFVIGPWAGLAWGLPLWQALGTFLLSLLILAAHRDNLRQEWEKRPRGGTRERTSAQAEGKP